MEIETSKSGEVAEEQMEVEGSEEMQNTSDSGGCDVSHAFVIG